MSYHVKNWKRVILFSFLLLSFFFNAQTFIRTSDEKTVENVVVLHAGKNIVIDKSNFSKFVFTTEDKVIYNGKPLDFSVSQDTLFFFDKVKEIEEIHVTNENLSSKKEKTINSEEQKYQTAQIFRNQLLATFVKVNAKKKTFVKSIIFFPDLRFFPHDIKGNVDIQILPNVNGFPDIDNPIISFKRDISETVQKKWEIVLPKIIKYPENGFFVSFYYQSNDKERERTADLKLNKNTSLYFYYPQNKEWKKTNINGYLYKMKVLQ